MQFDWTFPWLLLIGHWLGDYIFQTHEMATKKIADNWWCALHSWIYAVCVILVLVSTGILPLSSVWISSLIVFLTHYPIDRYSIGYKIMELKGGPDFTNPFAPIIYVYIDNGLHLILMIIFMGWLL